MWSKHARLLRAPRGLLRAGVLQARTPGRPARDGGLAAGPLPAATCWRWPAAPAGGHRTARATLRTGWPPTSTPRPWPWHVPRRCRPAWNWPWWTPTRWPNWAIAASTRLCRLLVEPRAAAAPAGWLDTLHARLQPGARVVLLDNSFVQTSSTPISRRDEAGNTYQLRTLDDGSVHEVLKNFPTPEASASAMLGPRARQVRNGWTCALLGAQLRAGLNHAMPLLTA
jgi:hypothetical protein